MDNIVVYTTAYVYEVDIVRNALKKAKIPFYIQSQTLGGIREAFQVSPAQGFGERWHFYVPQVAESDAKKLLSTLHLTVNSDRKPFPAISGRRLKKSLRKTLIVLSPILLGLAYLFYEAFVK